MTFVDVYSDTYSDTYGVSSGELRTFEGWTWYGADGSVFDLTRYTQGFQVTRGVTGIFGPPITIKRLTRPGLPGAVTTDVRHEVAEITIPCHTTGTSRSAVQQLLETFATSTDPTEGEGLLQHTRLDGSVRSIYCRFVGGLGSASDAARGPVAAILPLVFQADDPYWLGAVHTQGFVGGSSPSWFNMGTTGAWFPIPLGSSTILGDVEIDNVGTKEAYPVWTIIGPGTSPYVENTDTGERFSFDGLELATGELLRINTEDKTVQQADGANRFQDLSEYDLWPLGKGVNNVHIQLTGSTAASYVSVAYQDRYLVG